MPSIGDDAGGFLAAMLQRMQAERDDGRGVLPAEDAEHAAFVVKMVVGLGTQGIGASGGLASKADYSAGAVRATAIASLIR